MAFYDPILENFGSMFIPKGVRPGLKAYVLKAGYQDVPYRVFGQLFILVLIIFYGIFVFGIMPLFRGVAIGAAFALYFFSAVAILFVLAIMMMVFFYFWTSIKIFERTKDLELILPDYLMLVSTNLKGGMSFEKALWDAIKPEFGVLANEIGLVSKKVMTGNEIVDALQEFVVKYDSPILRRNFQLIISEFESGGKIVLVIDRIIVNLRKTQVLKKELAASTLTYMIFIGALVIVICPILFALSYQLFFLIQGFMGTIAGNTSAVQGALSLSAPDIAAGDFRLFSVLAIAIISIGSSFITSVIEKGDYSGILKYAPLYLFLSLLIYFISAWLLSGVFQKIVGM